MAKRDKDGKPSYQKPFYEVTELYLADDRDRIDREIVFDFDGPDRAANYASSERVEKFLQERSIPYVREEHNGRSPHLHIFFNVVGKDVDWHIARWSLAKAILRLSKVGLQESHVDMDIILRKSHLIREFKKDVPPELKIWEMSFKHYYSFIHEGEVPVILAHPPVPPVIVV